MRKIIPSLLGISALFFLVSASQTENLLRLLLSKQTGKLSIQNLDAANLQATYSRKRFDAEIEALEGVRIETEVNNDVERVKIQDLDGKAIVSYHHLRNDQNKAALINIMGQSFVTTKDKKGNRQDYHVPEVFSEGLNQVFSQGDFNSGYLKLLDSHVADTVRIAAIQEMLAGQEIPLMREAVEAIGQRGIIGKDNPSVLPVMAMVMRFSALGDNQMKKNKASSQLFSYFVTQPYSDCTPDAGQVVCPGNGFCCESEVCPKGVDDYCDGACGLGCKCLSWFCGDCCIHPGCAGHDKCCRENGSMLNTACLFPYGFSCDEKYEC